MQGIQLHVQFWSDMLLYGAALVVLISVPRFRGKGWLMSLVIVSALIYPFYYVSEVLQRFKIISFDESLNFSAAVYPVTRLIDLIGAAILIAVILELKSAMADRQSVGKALFSFRGRIPRHVYWTATVGLFAINISFWAIIADPINKNNKTATASLIVCLLWLPFAVWMSLAVQIKRWHDIDKSGWWVLIGAIPIVGAIWALIENGFTRGTIGNNSYGVDPNQPVHEITADCILCRVTTGAGGLSKMIVGVTLFPLCPACYERCNNAPEQILSQYPELFLNAGKQA